MPIVGAQCAFVSQLNWQIRHGWSRDKSLEEWHKRHPDMTDELFDTLYGFALREIRIAESIKNGLPTDKIGEIIRWTK